MATSRQLVRQASFGAGEFSRRALGRTDLPQYAAGLKSQSNWITSPQGSVTRRPGFAHKATTKTLPPTDFTERAPPATNTIRGIASSDTLIMCLGNVGAGDAYLITSGDSGVTWTRQTAGKNFGLQDACWSGSLWVAVGVADGTDPYVITSPDGVTWTDRTVVAADPKNLDLNAVCWNGSLFVAVGVADGSDAYIVTSQDGVTWLERANDSNVTLWDVCWTGSQFVAVGVANSAGSDAYILTSPDGITWTEQTSGRNTPLYGVVWAEELGLLCAVGAATGVPGSYILTSLDGVTWTERTSGAPLDLGLWSVCWTGTQLVAVGVAGGASGAYVISSPDGITWSENSNPKDYLLYAVHWTGGVVVAGGVTDTADSYLITGTDLAAHRKLETFVGSTGSPYMMELGHEYIRFFRDNYYLESSPGVTYEVVSPWAAADVADLQFAQANDVMYITHPDYTPRKLTRTGESTFTLPDLMDYATPAVNPYSSTYKLWDGPYLDENATVTTVTLSATGTGSKTATASTAIFASTDLGRAFRIFSAVDGSDKWGWGIITAFTSTTVVTVYMVEDPSTTSAETRWALGAWSGTTGYPRGVTFYQQRLIFAGTKQEPMGHWATVIASFEAFDPTQPDDTLVQDNAVYFTIASRRMLPSVWLESGQDLFVGTKGGVFRIDGGEGANQITPGSTRIRQASAYGAAEVLPALVGDILVYVQQGSRIVRALSPSADSNLLEQPDLTLLSEHMGKSGIEQMEFASVPSSVVWMRRADGMLIGLTLNLATKILGWHSHQLPGSLAGSSWPEVLSMAVLPLDGHDQLWVLVRRTVNSVQIETIEAMELPFDSTVVDVETACYLDSAVWYNGVATTAITGLDHLEGESVYAYADGIMQGPYTVASGAITLGVAASKVWAGLAYDTISDLETLPIKAVDANNAKVHVISTLVEVLDTSGLKVGIDSDSTTLIALNPPLTPDPQVSTTIKTLVTGDREHVLPGSFKTRATVLIRPDTALPATITGLTHTIEFNHV